jgi:SNF2 family DNA or RNA helicase
MSSLNKYFENSYLTLFEKQKEIIVEALKKRYFLIIGEQGSGKSITAFYIIKVWFMLGLVKKVLFITKREVLEKFHKELLLHIPNLSEKDVVYMRSNADRNILDKDAKIYLCDYNQIKLIYGYYAPPRKKDSTRKLFKKVMPLDDDWGVILDELQALKNIKSDVHKVVYHNLKGVRACIGTSGTPIEKIEEIYGIFRVIDQSILRMNYHFFMQTIAVLQKGTYRILYYNESGVKRIRKKIEPFIYILKKEEIKEVVNKTIIDLESEFNTKFKREYFGYIEDIAYEINERGYIYKRDVAPLIQKIYNKVKKVSLDNPRFCKFDNFIQRVISKEKVIVWERSPRIISSLVDYYESKGIKVISVDGSVQKDVRPEIISEFNSNPDIRIFVASFLTSPEAWEIPSRYDCRRMVFYSLPDRIITYSQCIDRVHRLNSTADVFIYRTILRGSIDEWALDLLAYKQKIRDGMIDNKQYGEIALKSNARYLGIDKKCII